MVQVVFIIDLPLKPSHGGAATETPFLDDFCYYLKGINFPDQLIEKVRLFDFSETARYAFVHSM